MMGWWHTAMEKIDKKRPWTSSTDKRTNVKKLTGNYELANEGKDFIKKKKKSSCIYVAVLPCLTV